MSSRLNIKSFIATAESVLIYGNERWTYSQIIKEPQWMQQKKLPWFWMALILKWQQYMRNECIYEDVSNASENTKQRWLRPSGYCYRHFDQEVSRLVTWNSLYCDMPDLHRKLDRRMLSRDPKKQCWCWTVMCGGWTLCIRSGLMHGQKNKKN